jgi:hypothetical protein
MVLGSRAFGVKWTERFPALGLLIIDLD